MANDTLYLIDAYGLIYRSYYAFIRRPVFNSKGLNTSAIYGFMTTLEEIIRREKPAYLAVLFDPPGKTFREELYPLYKANRQETPEAIKTSVPYIKTIVHAMNIPAIEVEGYEADDLAGTLAHKAAGEGFQVRLVTSDKDYGQLVTDQIKIYKPQKSGNEIEVLGTEEIKSLYQINHPRQLIDILALWGDASDNVPGAPGIGEKGAIKLIRQYGSVENLIEHAEELSGKTKEIVQTYRDQILLSKKLVTIYCEVPVSFSPASLQVKEYRKDELRKILQELDFKSLSARLLGEEKPLSPATGSVQPTLFDLPQPSPPVVSVSSPAGSPYQTIHSVDHHYVLVSSEEQMRSLIEKLSAQKEFCFDTETTGLDVHHDTLVGMSFCYKEHEAFFVPVDSDFHKGKQVVSLFKPLFENPSIAKTGHNLKFDMMMLKRYGIEVEGTLFDTLIAHYLLQPEQNHKMDALARAYLNYQPVAIEELIGEKGKHQRNMRDVDTAVIADYAAEDADVTFQLKKILEPELVRNGMENLFHAIEMPLVRVLIEMECNGFRIDTAVLNTYGQELNEKILALEKEIYELTGTHFNISSPKQLGEVLFEKLKITEDAKKTRTKQYSTSEETLQSLSDKHPVIDKILQYRGLKKLLSTYVEALPLLVNKETGKVHTSFNQTVTSTGRLSSTNPNLQNIPVRDEEGREIRKAFVASDEDYLLLSADYSQIELRIMAHYSQDENMIAAFRNNEDIHTATASKIFGVPPQQVTPEQRRKAKTANFGIIYGISPFGLSQRLKISRKEASALISGYFSVFPGIRQYMNRMIEETRKKGYVTTLYNRRRYLPDIHSANATVRGFAERNAINTPIQGTAADIIKIAMVNIYRRFKEEKIRSKMILQVHDELLFDVFIPEMGKVKEIVVHEMEHAATLSVPLTVDAGTGKNWLEAH